MDDQQKNSDENKARPVAPVVITTIIATLIVVGIASLISSSNPSPSTQQQSVTSNNEANPSAPQQIPQTQNMNSVNLVALKSKCSTDGKNFVQSYEHENGSPKTVWQTPQFHYDTKLNTCIVYIGYFVNLYQSDISNPTFTMTLLGYNFVFDIYANQALLQNVFDRTDTNGNNTDTLSSYPLYSNVANLDGSTFDQKMQVLMSE